MSLMFGGFLHGDKFEWKSHHHYDLSEDVVFQFFVPTYRHFGTRAEACDFAAHFVRKLGWCFTGPNGIWSFDFDKLRESFPLAVPDWLQGSASTGAVPRPVKLTPPKQGEPPKPDAIEISCRFCQDTPPPDLVDLIESANRPVEISESLSRFRQDYPDPSRVAFVIMKFDTTSFHQKIFYAVEGTLKQRGMHAVRADGKEYHPNLFENVLTYLHGSRFGIAVVERLTGDDFNPNVSLEIGYLLALRKPVCILKDRTLRTLVTDLTGRLYRSFDPQDPQESIPRELETWMRDNGLLARS